MRVRAERATRSEGSGGPERVDPFGHFGRALRREVEGLRSLHVEERTTQRAGIHTVSGREREGEVDRERGRERERARRDR